jgi:hypothetical protein
MNGQTIRTITIRGTSEGLDKLTADLGKLAAAEQNVAVVSDDLSKKQLSLEQAWKRQTLRLDEAARAQANIARETKIADNALREGLATQAQHAQRLEQINQRYALAGQATQKFATQTGLARHELINLGRQAQDVGVSLASGQSPLMVLAQQGSQIADVFISSGKSVGQFFTQAIDWAVAFAKTPTGIVTGILAIGGAAIYAASQFFKSSTTIEEALKEQKRLLNETKTAIDDLIAAQIKLQSKQLTQFELIRNELDLRNKLKEAMTDAVEMAPKIAPTLFPGEMGAVPPEMAAGYEKIATAVERLNAAREAGQPGMVAFADELGRIGREEPALAKVIEKMVQAGQQGRDVEAAWLKVRAALQSAAQVELTNLRTKEAAEATERQAQATLKMAQAYPGMTIETAKTLEGLKGQLGVAQAVGVTEQLSAQRRATINQLLLEGKTLQEATAIANAQQAVAEAQIIAAHLLRMEGLRDQLNIAQQITGLAQINAQHEAKINELLLQGLPLHYAIAEADLEREITLARINAQAEQQLRNLQNQYELIRATSEEEKGRISARQEYDKLIESGVSAEKAGQIAAQMQANARATEDAKEETKKLGDETKKLGDETERVKDYSEEYGENLKWVNTLLPNHKAALDGVVYAWSQISDYMQSYQFSLSGVAGGGPQFNPAGYETSIGPDPKKMASAADALYGKGNWEWQRANPWSMNRPVPSGGWFGSRSLTEKIDEMLKANTDATKENTAATQGMTDVLSPFYSSDPRRTHLGFRSFAGGGIMTPYGELPLKQYQGGGVATSPQVAVYGEGRTPEAYVPIPSGRIPVEIKQPANSNQRPVNVTINVMGNADANTVAALKATAFQQAQSMRRALA